MKKITLILLAALLVAAAVLVPVIATTAGGVTASEAAGKPGEIVTVTFSLHDFPKVQAIGANFTVPEGLTLVEDEEQSKWLIDDPMLVDFDGAAGMAAVGYAKAADFTAARDILQFAFVIDEPTDKPLSEQIDFNVHFVIKNDKNEKTELDATAKISVSAPADAVTLDKNTLTLDLSGNKQDTLTATVKPAYTTDSVQWSSDNETVVTVDENGKVTAVACGNANITVTAGKVSASCAVTVTCTHANAVETPAKEATCEDGGNNNYWYCADCAQYLKADKETATTLEAETLAALGHKPTYYAEVKATCVEIGHVAYWNCANCNNNYEDEACTKLIEVVQTEIDPNNHVGNTQLRNVAAANCYVNGYTGDTYCLSCEAMIDAGDVIPATGKHIAASAWLGDATHHWHACTTEGCPAQVDKAEHQFQWVEDKAATEDATGLKHEECDCGYTRSEGTVIEKLPHTHVGIQHHAAVAATCVEKGNKEYWTCASSKCTGKYFMDAACEKEYTESVILPVDASNHVGGTELKDVKAENCYQDGFTGNTCCVSCGAVTVPGSVIPATGKHVAASGWKNDETDHWHTCTTNGCTAQVDKTEHTYQWKIDKAATEYATGLKHEECECGLKRNENTVIPKLDHVHKDIQHHAAEAATCVKAGRVEYWTCGSDLCEGKFYGDAACQSLLESIVEVINPNNHTGGTELKDAKAENCYQEGFTGNTCCVSCGAITVPGTVIPATGKHVAGTAWETDGDYHWHVCTTNGCGAVLEKAVHTFEWKTDKEATEYATGLKHEECFCGAKRNEGTVIDKLEHVHRDIKHYAAVAATCVKTGTVEYWTCGSDLCEGKFYGDAQCKNLLDTIVEKINSSNHVGGTVVKNAAEANCYQNGYTGDTHCKSCDARTAVGTVIPATGNHIAGTKWYTDDVNHWHVCTTSGCTAAVDQTAHTYQWKVDKAATEYATGLKHEECLCGAKRNEGTVIPKLDHVHKDIKYYAAVAATCVKTGTVEYWTCGSDLCEGKFYGDANCQALLDTIVAPIDPSNHTGGTTLKNQLAATCGADGYTGDTYCADCDQLIKKGTAIAATGKHTAGKDYVSDGEQHWKVCTACETKLDAAAHQLQWIVDSEPSEEVTGKKHQKCDICGYICSENTEIDKLEHAPKLVAGKANTCTEDGVAEHFFCDNCGRYFACVDGVIGEQITAEDTVLKATGHTYATEWTADATGHWHACHCGDVADRAAHAGVVIGAVEATKTEAGYTGDTVCSICEYMIVKGEVVLSKQDAVLENIENAQGGASVEIAVPNEDGSVDATVSVEVLESAKGKDVQLVLNMGDYAWTIAGNKIFAAGQALDMTVSFDLNNIPADVVAAVAGDAATQQLSFAHSGAFGFEAELEVALEKAFAGKTGNVYRYNANKELELVTTEQIGADGKIAVMLDTAADYVIIVSDEGPADTSDTLLTVVIIAAIAVMAMAAEVVLIAKRKKIR